MMSDNRTETPHKIVKNTTNSLANDYSLHSKKLQVGLSTSIEMSDVSDVSENKKQSTCFSDDESTESGLDFLLCHFGGQHSLFPRNIATGATNGGQKTVNDRDRAILFIQGARMEDCMLSVYPNYEELLKNGCITSDYLPKPDHIFIDLDLKQFGNDINKLNQGLKVTLRNIHRLLNAAVPTVIWSGGGYHIHQPLDANALPIFENVPEFKRFKDITTEFMRYTERRLTNYKSDPCHKIAWKSCLARIPNTINTKYPAKVRIVQRWNGTRAKPSRQFLVSDFLIWLVQDELNTKIRLHKQAQKWVGRRQLGEQQRFTSKPVTDTAIPWIDKLLQTPIEDYRKHVVALILAPYLLTIKRMSLDQSYNIIGNWLSTCNSIRRLEPAGSQFMRIVVKPAIDRTIQKSTRPMKWVTLQDKNPSLYELLLEEMNKKI